MHGQKLNLARRRSTQWFKADLLPGIIRLLLETSSKGNLVWRIYPAWAFKDFRHIYMTHWGISFRPPKNIIYNSNAKTATSRKSWKCISHFSWDSFWNHTVNALPLAVGFHCLLWATNFFFLAQCHRCNWPFCFLFLHPHTFRSVAKQKMATIFYLLPKYPLDFLSVSIFCQSCCTLAVSLAMRYQAAMDYSCSILNNRLLTVGQTVEVGILTFFFF